MSIEPFTEDERHRAYQDAQRRAYIVALHASEYQGQDGSLDRHATMWATVALALRRDGVQ